MPPIPRIPHDLGRASDVLEAVCTVLEHLGEAYGSSIGPQD
jgi:hypothetical protein